MTHLKLKRAYAPSVPSDGFRIYIDRLWPQGLSHETFHYDAWDKAIAPGKELREWFHQNRDANWKEFETRYQAELKANPEWPRFIGAISAHPVVTLLYSSKNEKENNAVIVLDTLLAEKPGLFTA